MIYLAILNIILVVITVINLIIIHKKKQITQDDFIKSFIENVNKIPLFFINIKVKPDGNILYFVDSAKVIKADTLDFKWVILDYVKDKKHIKLKLPTYAVFLTAEEANAFLLGNLSLDELDFMEA